MKLKFTTTLSLAIWFFLVTNNFVLLQANEPPQLIETLKVEDHTDQFFYCYDQIRRDPDSSEDTKVRLKIRFLFIIHQFLKTHERPQGTTYMNMLPPDGGISGTSPEGIKDPVLRAKYQKMLDDNNALADAQMKHRSLSSMQTSIAESLAAFIQVKSENLKLVSVEIDKNSNKPESAKELEDLIDQASFERLKKVPLWPKVEVK